MMRTSGMLMRTSQPSMLERAVAALPVPMLPISRMVSSSRPFNSSYVFIGVPRYPLVRLLMVVSTSSAVVTIFSA